MQKVEKGVKGIKIIEKILEPGTEINITVLDLESGKKTKNTTVVVTDVEKPHNAPWWLRILGLGHLAKQSGFLLKIKSKK